MSMSAFFAWSSSVMRFVFPKRTISPCHLKSFTSISLRWLLPTASHKISDFFRKNMAPQRSREHSDRGKNTILNSERRNFHSRKHVVSLSTSPLHFYQEYMQFTLQSTNPKKEQKKNLVLHIPTSLAVKKKKWQPEENAGNSMSPYLLLYRMRWSCMVQCASIVTGDQLSLEKRKRCGGIVDSI